MAIRPDNDPVIYRASGAKKVRQSLKGFAIVMSLHGLFFLPLGFFAYRGDFVSNWNGVLFILFVVLMDVAVYFLLQAYTRWTIHKAIFRVRSASCLYVNHRKVIESKETLKYTLHAIPGSGKWLPSCLQVSNVEGKYLLSHGVLPELRERLKREEVPYEINYWSIPTWFFAIAYSFLSMRSTQLRELSDYFIAFAPLLAVFWFIFGFSRPKVIKRSNPKTKSRFDKVKLQVGFGLGGLAASIGISALSLTPLSQSDRDFVRLEREWRTNPSSESLSSLVLFSEQSGHARHLNSAAWALITDPNPDHRDYVKAENLAKSAVTKAKKAHIVGLSNIADTYACSLMGLGKREEALKVAGQIKSKKRIQKFTDGKLCEEEHFKVAALPAEAQDRQPAGDESPE